MKIFIAVLLVLLVCLGLTGWQLKQSLSREGAVREQLAQSQGALRQAELQNGALVGRFDTLDAALQGLNAAQKKNQAELTGRLATIKNIVQEPGDTDESISCLDVRVPAQLDRGLR